MIEKERTSDSKGSPVCQTGHLVGRDLYCQRLHRCLARCDGSRASALSQLQHRSRWLGLTRWHYQSAGERTPSLLQRRFFFWHAVKEFATVLPDAMEAQPAHCHSCGVALSQLRRCSRLLCWGTGHCPPVAQKRQSSFVCIMLLLCGMHSYTGHMTSWLCDCSQWQYDSRLMCWGPNHRPAASLTSHSLAITW